ncbi:MAG: hypothetical protein JJT81_01665 [Rubellimicrobium sp.]|nr:hypothetical protein [Rubellimicrobium sp.]
MDDREGTRINQGADPAKTTPPAAMPDITRPEGRPEVVPRRVPPRSDGIATERPAPKLALRYGALVLVVIGDKARESQLVQWITRSGGTAVVVNTDLIADGEVTNETRAWDFALIHTDAFGDPTEAYDLCVRLRNGAPGLPIILVDSELHPRDLTPFTMGLCDAQLEADYTDVALAHAHQTATFVASFVEQRAAVDPMTAVASARPMIIMDEGPTSQSGWWILPAMLLGLGFWISVGVIIFGR